MSGTLIEMGRTTENALSSVFLWHCLLPVVNICFFQSTLGSWEGGGKNATFEENTSQDAL